MGELRPVEPVLLFCGILYSRDSHCVTAKKLLVAAYGELLAETDPVDFTFTDYYSSEMGGPIMRSFVAFRSFVDPVTLADVKIRTNQIEDQFLESGGRTVNLDPGYLDLSKVVLASTKDFAHRVYLGKQIYGEVTLSWRAKGKQYHDQPWSYPDYKTEYAKCFFSGLRTYYHEQSEKRGR